MLGFGDSSQVEPTEESVVKDCLFIYKWVTNKTIGDVFVWGHSLGTSISTHMLSILNENIRRPVGLILESPFNNLREEIREHPLSTVSIHFEK